MEVVMAFFLLFFGICVGVKEGEASRERRKVMAEDACGILLAWGRDGLSAEYRAELDKKVKSGGVECREVKPTEEVVCK